MKSYFVLLAVSLTGCSSLSGLDGSSKFSCKAPDGVSCSSLSGVYANASQNNLPGLQVEKPKQDDKSKGEGNAESEEVRPAVAGTLDSNIVGKPLNSGDPLYAPSKILRVWIAPWEDADGDLHDQSYVYIMADYGRWIIEHNRQRIIDQYRPTNRSTTGSIAEEMATAKQNQSLTSDQYARPALPDGSYNRPQSAPAPTNDYEDMEAPF